MIFNVEDEVKIPLNDGRVLEGKLVEVCPRGKEGNTPLAKPHIVVETTLENDFRRTGRFPKVYYAMKFGGKLNEDYVEVA
jgi:hypothetical protein